MPLDRDLVELRVGDVLEAIAELRRIVSKEFREMSIDERYSMRYNLIVLVESLASLCLHVALEHYGLRPRSYAECFRRVSERLSVSCYGDLESLARLMNILVHRYWVVRDDAIYDSVRRDFGCVMEFLSKVRGLVTG